MAFGPDGKITVVEMKGPASFKVWKAAWKAFRTACIMYDIVDPEVLDAYADKIEKKFNKAPSCWALLYQAESRTRLEHMPRVRDEMHEEYEEAIYNRARPEKQPYNPSRP